MKDRLIKEEDLQTLGFERTDVSPEESGADAFHYYTYDFKSGKKNKFGLALISCSDDEAMLNNYAWTVQIFDYDQPVFTRYVDVRDLIDIINSNIKSIGI